MPLSFIDLFAGIGGMRLAFEQANCKCVFSCEIDKFARKSYEANHKIDHSFCEDIRSLNIASLPSYDILVAGFPCQPFSAAGIGTKQYLNKEYGFEDKAQGTLFFELAKIIKETRPKAFLLENVSHLKNSNKGNTLNTILSILRDDLGYYVPDPRIFEASSFVPQIRKRLFIVGFSSLNNFSWDLNSFNKERLQLRNILHASNEQPESPYTNIIDGNCCVSDVYTLSNSLWEWLQKHKNKHKSKGNGFGYNLVGEKDTAISLSARYSKDGSEILIEQKDKNPRKLTPRECARLMGFSDSFKIVVSNTQAYKQFGNSVVVPLVAEIARQIVSAIDQEKTLDANFQKTGLTQRGFSAF